MRGALADFSPSAASSVSAHIEAHPNVEERHPKPEETLPNAEETLPRVEETLFRAVATLFGSAETELNRNALLKNANN